jgi:hypothetical protein
MREIDKGDKVDNMNNFKDEGKEEIVINLIIIKVIKDKNKII